MLNKHTSVKPWKEIHDHCQQNDGRACEKTRDADGSTRSIAQVTFTTIGITLGHHTSHVENVAHWKENVRVMVLRNYYREDASFHSKSVLTTFYGKICHFENVKSQCQDRTNFRWQQSKNQFGSYSHGR